MKMWKITIQNAAPTFNNAAKRLLVQGAPFSRCSTGQLSFRADGEGNLIAVVSWRELQYLHCIDNLDKSSIINSDICFKWEFYGILKTSNLSQAYTYQGQKMGIDAIDLLQWDPRNNESPSAQLPPVQEDRNLGTGTLSLEFVHGPKKSKDGVPCWLVVFHQPIWKICAPSNWVNAFPNFRGENEKNIWVATT